MKNNLSHSPARPTRVSNVSRCGDSGAPVRLCVFHGCDAAGCVESCCTIWPGEVCAPVHQDDDDDDDEVMMMK